MIVNESTLHSFEDVEMEEERVISNEDVMNKVVIFKRSVQVLRKLNFFTKRVIDIVGSVVGIILLIPLIFIVKIMNLLNKDDGPMFYSQERIGKNGEIFKMYKFRSMVMNADEKLEELLKNDPEARAEYKKYKKLRNDPRVTKFGEFLRKTSLDEFPQFINVLKGEMSLVGPRAYLPKEKEDMGDSYSIIIRCTPGLTGLWQTSGRSNVTFKERLQMDLDYYSTQNINNDIKILIQTIVKILGKEGAM